MASVPAGITGPMGNSELYSLNQMLNLPAPAMAWKWRVTAAAFPEGIGIPLEYFHAVPLTFQSIEAVPFHRQATSHTIPGFESIGTISVTLYETDTYDVTKQIQRWRRLIKDDTGLYTIPFPTATIELTCYTNQNTPSLRAHLYDMWPSSQSPSELSYDNNQRLSVQVEFSLNRVRVVAVSAPAATRPAIEGGPRIMPATPTIPGPPVPTFPSLQVPNFNVPPLPPIPGL